MEQMPALMTKHRILQFLRSGLPAQQLFKTIKTVTKDPEQQMALINAARIYAGHQQAINSKIGPFGNHSNAADAEVPRPLARLSERINNKSNAIKE